MIKNMLYKVTKESTDGTFQVGDTIRKYDDGAIGCTPVEGGLGGWIPESNADSALLGCEYEIDEDYYKKKIEKINAEKAEIERILG